LPLSPEAAVRHLLDLDLLHPRELVDGEVHVTDVRGRNVNLRVETSGPRRYFIKQAPPAASAAPLAVESWFHARAATDAASARLRPFLAPFAHHDATRGLLVMELLADAEPLDFVMARASLTAPPRIGEPLGVALAACHRAFPAPSPLPRAGGAPRQRRPWALDIHAPTPDTLRDISSAQLTLTSLLQQHEPATRTMDRLRDEWTTTALVHGDLKWSNVLVMGDDVGDSESPVDLRIVDWEFCSWGDPAWDVGSVLHSFLVDCVAHASDAADVAAHAPAAFTEALPAAQREMARFWHAYIADASLGPEAAAALLGRAAGLAGVRLIQTAYESSEAQEELPRFAAGDLQLGINILARPQAAAKALFGISHPAGTKGQS